MASPHLDPPNGPFTEHPDSHQWPSPANTLVAYRRWYLERYHNMPLRRFGIPRRFPTQSLALDLLLIPAKTADCESAFNLTVIGLPALHITGHSFRRGAAQHADEAGLSRDQIHIQRRRLMIPHNATIAPDTLEQGQRMRSFLHCEIARSCEAAIPAFALFVQR
ncbi:hypothetical protein E4U09_005041 [Claviceps aff. purpurea]|uniref:Uncharacterized protein n=1 Tax=Claviceps aff. purpurea TaxID=1967640 RepID=A0A9P7QCE7_9HYPO|nr:hypothetical protein E4U09_005041 [Claviceps aff. purpurea]